MFEKEAEEWLERYKFRVFDEGKCNDPNLYAWSALAIKECYIAGAEFGYKLAHEEMDYLNKHWGNGKDKANEWHFVKNGDLPKISDSTIRTLKPVIVAVVNGIETSTYGTYWNEHTGRFECLDKVYAWCDVPESPKESE